MRYFKVHLIIHFLNVYWFNIFLTRVSVLHIWLSFTIHYFIFHFKCCSILHFAICQLLCWAFLLKKNISLIWHHINKLHPVWSVYFVNLKNLTGTFAFKNQSSLTGSLTWRTCPVWPAQWDIQTAFRHPRDCRTCMADRARTYLDAETWTVVPFQTSTITPESIQIKLAQC